MFHILSMVRLIKIWGVLFNYYLIYKAESQKWYTQLVKEQELEIYSQDLSKSTVLLHSRDISSPTELEITLISSSTDPSTRVCHTSTTTERLVKFSTSPHTPSESLSTRCTMEESSQRESMSELNIAESQEVEWPLSKELSPTIKLRSLPRPEEKRSHARDSQSNQLKLILSRLLTFRSSTHLSSESFTERG